MNKDTIAAVATGPAAGAIGIIRLSGPRAVAIAEETFLPKNCAVHMLENRKLTYGHIIGKDGKVLDMAMCVVMRAPNSYTGEDCVELHCHGGQLLLAAVMELLLANGARHAERGEFTKRAFLNGKMDLTAAEAVADILSAGSEEALRNAASQLNGTLWTKIEQIRSSLLDLCAHFTAYIDYTEEGVEPPDLKDAAERLELAGESLTRLAVSYKSGRAAQEGVRTAIIGRPNTGKSSLLNAFAGMERSIVTGIEGTTRDVVEQTVRVDGIPLLLMDTAGIRKTDDEVERIGVNRAENAAKEASLVLAVFDSSRELTEDDLRIMEFFGREETIAVVNKSDLAQRADMDTIQSKYRHICTVSAKTGEGMEELTQTIGRLYRRDGLAFDGGVITNIRQAEGLRRSAGHCRQAAEALRQGFTPDVAWVDAEAALTEIGMITGERADADILQRVFERFCVGK